MQEKVKVKLFSTVRLFATPWTVAYHAPLSMGFSRQEQWSGLPFPSPEDLPHPGIEPGSPTLWADALPSEPPGKSNAGECRLDSWVEKILCRRKWQPTPQFLPGKYQEQRRLVTICHTQGCKRVGHGLVTKITTQSIYIINY